MAPKAATDVDCATFKTILERNTFFPFLSLPPELRIMIYELIMNYEDLHAITVKTNQAKDCNNRDAAYIRKAGLERRVKGTKGATEPRFRRTTGVLLLNKQVYAEALPVLRRAPLIIDREMLRVFRRFRLTIAHYVPFSSLKNIEHIHFAKTLPALEDSMLLWHGALLTADINQNQKRIKAVFPGILQAEGMTVPEYRISSKRHLDTHPEGRYALRKISFEKLCATPMMLDLCDDDVKPELVKELEEFYSLEFDLRTHNENLKALVSKYGKQCRSYTRV